MLVKSIAETCDVIESKYITNVCQRWRIKIILQITHIAGRGNKVILYRWVDVMVIYYLCVNWITSYLHHPIDGLSSNENHVLYALNIRGTPADVMCQDKRPVQTT